MLFLQRWAALVPQQSNDGGIVRRHITNYVAGSGEHMPRSQQVKCQQHKPQLGDGASSGVQARDQYRSDDKKLETASYQTVRCQAVNSIHITHQHCGRKTRGEY